MDHTISVMVFRSASHILKQGPGVKIGEHKKTKLKSERNIPTVQAEVEGDRSHGR